jgi:hypothetical protein
MFFRQGIKQIIQLFLISSIEEEEEEEGILVDERNSIKGGNKG